MINKIKDFLKNKLKRKSSEDFSDQEEAIKDAEQDQELPEHTGSYQYESQDEDVDAILKPSLKEHLSSKLSSITSRLKSINLRGPKFNVKLPKGLPLLKSGEGLLLSPNLSQKIERLLSRPSREPIHQFFLVLIIGSITYSIAKMTAIALKGPPVLPATKDVALTIPFERDFNPGTLTQVRTLNVFRSNTGAGTRKEVADSKCEKAQQTSNLPIKLVNTIVLQDSIKSLASVQVRGDRALQEIREGEQISNLAKIFKITRLEILVKNLENGVCESISSDKMALDRRRSPISVMSPSASREYKLSKKIPGIENVGNKFSVQRSFLDEKMKDIASVLTQARAIKIQNPDGTIAFKLTEMDPEGIFPYLGLQDQDIITSINGKPIYDMNEVMSLFARIKNLDQLSLGVRREGAESVQEYSIKK